MAGYTGFSVGMVSDSVVYIPLFYLVTCGQRKVKPFGKNWHRLISNTGQKPMLNSDLFAQKQEEWKQRERNDGQMLKDLQKYQKEFST